LKETLFSRIWYVIAKLKTNLNIWTSKGRGVDTNAQEVYYKPCPGEDMSTAVVVAPKLETMIKLMGALDNPVHNIQFYRISFELSTW
jgi:hypothetical protein